MKKVSVVIPSYNRADAAIRCAKSALSSDYPDDEFAKSIEGKLFDTWYSPNSALQALSISLAFTPVISVRYALIALQHRRPDIALAFFSGFFAGLLRAPGCIAGKKKRRTI